MRLGLRTKLLGGVLLILTPVLGLMLVGFQAEYARQQEAVLDGLTQTGEAIASMADGSFDEALTLARTLADDPAVQTLDPVLLDPYFERLARHRPDLNYLGVFDGVGDERGAALRLSSGRINVADRSYFRQAMETGAPTLSDVFVGRVTGRLAVAAAAPLPGPAGVAVVGLNLDVLARSLEGVGLQPGQAILLAGPTGLLAFHTAAPDLPWEQRDVSSWPEIQAALRGATLRTVFRSPLLGDERVAAFVPTPKYRWVVGINWPASQAFGPLEATHRLQLLGFAAVASAAILGMVLLATFLTGPVRELAHLAEAFGRGDLRRRAEIRTGDELEELAATFNRMAEGLLNEREWREDYLRAISHDLRSPLNVVQGYAQTLLRKRETDPQHRPALEAIVIAARRMNTMIEDLVDSARIEAGQVKLNREPVDLASFVLRVREGLAGGYEADRIRLRAVPGLPPVSADPDKLERILTNLLTNALKYSTPGTEVTVTLTAGEGDLTCAVADRGPGIAPESQPRLFSRYFRGSQADERREGLGLGLHVTKGLVEAHGGRIWAESEVGEGSIFRFALPLARPDLHEFVEDGQEKE